LEAALYGRIKTEAVIVDSEEEKLEKTFQIIQRESSVACLILCNNQESAVNVEQFLQNRIPNVYTIHEEISSLEANR
jgi:superfamily II DNA/RNA helicase